MKSENIIEIDGKIFRFQVFTLRKKLSALDDKSSFRLMSSIFILTILYYTI